MFIIYKIHNLIQSVYKKQKNRKKDYVENWVLNSMPPGRKPVPELLDQSPNCRVELFQKLYT